MVVVGTYNMSFASDKGYISPDGNNVNGSYPDGSTPPVPPSESSFLQSNTDNNRRQFWLNAKDHLKHFIEKKNPLAVGLQEMNLTEDNSGIDTTTGIDAIKDMIKDMITNTNYKIISEKVKMNNAGISIIYDTAKAGEVVKHHIEDNMNQINGPAPKGGRPLLMVLTEKGYLFVCMHGAQDARKGQFEDDFNEYMINKNKNFLEEKVNTFLGDKTPDHIYIMGDFNDRYDAITDFTIKGKSVFYKGDSPKACCHNWDSMGKEGERETIMKKELEGPTLEAAAANASTKVQGKKSITINNEEKKGPIKIPEEHGINIADYINKGDKVFSSDNHAGELHIYTGDMSEAEYMKKPSNKSDHELVYMEINELRKPPAPAATEGAAPVETEGAAPVETEGAAPTAGGWSLFKGGKRKSRKGRKSKKNKKSNRKTKKMARKSKKRGKK